MKYLSCAWHAPLILSLSLRRAWIEIIIVSPFADALRCRSPYGDRGLKCRHGELRRPIAESLSLRRAWIEIFSRASSRAETCRSPYGERGLKSRSIEIFSQKVCRSPYGERGLKFRQAAGEGSHRESLSLRRAWIEMATSSRAGVIRSSRSPYGERGLKYRNYRNCAGFPCRSPYGERGLKLGVTVYAVVFGVSLFLRRAWIEMSLGSSYLTASLCRSPYGECGLK